MRKALEHVIARTRETERRDGTIATIVLVAVAVTTCSLTGCAHVAAYDRGRLAHPAMQTSHATSASRDHVYAVQEGALGGSMQASSGCGCN